MLERGEAVGPTRHHQVEQYSVRRVALHRRYPRAAVRRLRRLEPFRFEQGGDHLTDVRLVIDEQHAGAHAAVSTMENVAPPPGVSATVMLPLWASIVCRTRASPRPAPSRLTAISIDPRPPIASAALRSRFANARRSGS